MEPSDALLSRKFVVNPTTNDALTKDDPFSIVTYNILADCHLRRGNYSHTEPKTLDLSYRHERLMLELKHFDSDIICLQEVEPTYYSDVLSPAFTDLGYEGIFRKRVTTQENNYYDEGEATFIRKLRFSVMSQTSYSLKDLAHKVIDDCALNDGENEAACRYVDNASVVLISKLKCLKTGFDLTIGNIHVTYGNMKYPDEQCIEIMCALNKVIEIAGSSQSAHLIVGDFNSRPSSAAYQLLSCARLSDTKFEELLQLDFIDLPNGTKTSLVNLLKPDIFKHSSTSLSSAYFECLGKEPNITTITINNCDTFDYMFYNKDALTPLGVVSTPDDEVLKTHCLLPNPVFPSDHVSMKAVFQFMK